MGPIVVFENVGVSLGGRPVLADIDLVVDPGASVGVAGPNGSGKTTLARTAATLLAVDSGKATILGAEASGGGLGSVRREIGLIGHQPTLIPELTLHENLDHVARLAGIDRTRVARALDVVGLAGAADRRASECSFGMKRRVEIAHLLLTRPRLLLLDEAASGLDDSARELVTALVTSVRERDGACIVVSHDHRHLRELCDEVRTLSAGGLAPG